MRMGPLDGSVEEVRGLLENNGLKLEEYLEKATVPLKTRFLVIPGMFFAVSLCALCLASGGGPVWVSRLLYTMTFGCGTWVCG